MMASQVVKLSEVLHQTMVQDKVRKLYDKRSVWCLFRLLVGN